MALFNFIVKQDQELLKQIIHKLNCMAKSQSEVAQELRDIKAQNEKARTEIVQKIADLEAAIVAAGNSTPEVDTALEELKVSVHADDEMHPDAEPPPPEA